jgi:hypothetical protein
MQVRECAFRLPNGKQCRCAATRNQPFCRHHGPKPAVAGPPPIPANQLYSRLRCWREMGREIPWLDPSEIPGAIDAIQYALLNDGISDLAAGRFLRALIKRLGCLPSELPRDVPQRPGFAAPTPQSAPPALGTPTLGGIELAGLDLRGLDPFRPSARGRQ